MNIFVKHFNNFYKPKIKFVILYLIFNFFALLCLIYINKNYQNYLNKDIINICILIYYSFFIVIYFFLNFISNFIDVRYMCFKPLSDMFFKSFESILKKDYSEFCSNNPNNYLYYIFEVPQFIMLNFPSFVYIISSIMNILIVAYILFNSMPIPFLVIFVLSIFAEIFLKTFYRKITQNWKEVSVKTKILQNNILNIFSAIWHVKIYSLEKYCQDKVKEPALNLSNSFCNNKLNNHLLSIFIKAKSYIFEIIFLLMIFFTNIDKKLNIVEIIFSVFLINIFLDNFSRMISSIIDIKKGKELLINFYNIIENSKIINTNIEYLDNKIINSEIIKIINGSFSYKAKENNKKINGKINEKIRLNLIKNLNLTIHRGDKIVIVGENGSGKTTLLKLLANILKFDNGKVQYNKAILDFDPFSKTNLKINFVGSNPYIFNISLKENICFDNNIEEDIIFKILDNLNLTKFCNSLPSNINSIIEKNSMTISDGEKLRIALGRAILNKDKIDIIFLDEFTKNIDSKTEKKVINELFKKFKEKTIIAVSHRLSTISRFDKIIFLDMNNKEILFDNRDKIMNSPQFIKLFMKKL